jgi:predicted Fe-S protein YdhL (DUF1289 family)
MNIRPSGDIRPAQASDRHSPCVGVCTLDPAMGWCLGCGRTGDEIASWIGLDDAGRLAIWNELPARLDRLAVRARLLPWTRDELKRWITRTLTDRKGTWVTGVPGAVAEFPVRPERAIEIEADEAAIEAQATDAHLRLRLHDKLRAFAFAGSGPIVLAWPRNRAGLPRAQGFTPLGLDQWVVITARTNCSISVSIVNAAGSCFEHPASHSPRRYAGMRERVWSHFLATREPPFYKRARIVSSKAPWRALRCSRGFLCPQKSRRKGRIPIFSRRSSSLAPSCPPASPYLLSRAQSPSITPWWTRKRDLTNVGTSMGCSSPATP